MKDYSKIWAWISISIVPFAAIAWYVHSPAQWWFAGIFCISLFLCLLECREKQQYKTGPVLYDNDRELYYVHVGKTDNTLLYTCYGKNQDAALQSAARLIKLLMK